MRELRRKKDIWEYTGERITPQDIVGCLDDAINTMSYSNLHRARFERAKEIVLRYAREHGEPLGLTNAQWEYQDKRKRAAKHKKEMAAAQKLNRAINSALRS